MAFNKYHVVKVSQSSYVEVYPELLNGEQFVRIATSVGPVNNSISMTRREALELIGCIADVAGLDEIGNVCADLGFEPA